MVSQPRGRCDRSDLFDYDALELDTEAQRGPSEAVMDGGDVEPSAAADVNRHAHLEAWLAYTVRI